ncbi:MAG: HAD family hydrolase [Dehalococcoidia bacterium]|nr:HAD family hydrolase [Dehalococcoidia bacterium]
MSTEEDVRVTAFRIQLAVDDGALDQASRDIAGLASRPETRSLVAPLLVRLGAAKLAAGNAEAALQAARDALAIDENTPGGAELAARAATLAGAHHEATAHLARLARGGAPGDCLRLARSLQRTGDTEAARAAATRAVRGDQDGSVLAAAADVFAAIGAPGPATPIRVAFAGSSTLEPVAAAFRALAAAEGFAAETWLAPFGQYAEQLLDPSSGLYGFQPQLVVLAVSGRAIVPAIYGDPLSMDANTRRMAAEGAADELMGMVRAARANSSATILVHLAATPARSPIGMLDRAIPYGQAETIAHFNSRISAAAREMQGVYPVDLDRLVAALGEGGAFDRRTELLARIEAGPRLASALGETYLAAARALLGKSRKCLVTDLDNTLWGGVVGEDGVAGIQLGHDFPGSAYRAVQEELLALKRRGVLLAISSKNNEADAMEVLEGHPDMVLRPRDFAAMRINWRDKHENLVEIARELNIGLDSIVFLDDNPAECAMVRAALPQVEVVNLLGDPAHFAGIVRRLTHFDTLQLTDEDLRRTEMYAQGRERTAWERAHATTIEEHLRELGLVLDVAPAPDHAIGRVAQLLAKTNQFNTTTLRMPDDAVRCWATTERQGVLCARVRDRFGDHGLVGVAMWSRAGDEVTIDTFVLSCRVLGRGVERAFLAAVVDDVRARGASQVRGRFIPTAKNAPAASLFRDCGFEQLSATDWMLDVRESTVEPPAWITTTTEAPGRGSVAAPAMEVSLVS